MPRRAAPPPADEEMVYDSECSSGAEDDQECAPKFSDTDVFALSSYFNPAKQPRASGAPISLAELDLPPEGGGGEGPHPRKLVAALPVAHHNEKEALRVRYEQQFATWLFQLRQGFSLLFYGYGSKRALLDKFVREAATDSGVLAVNCLALGLTARQILVKAAGMVTRNGPGHFRGMSDDAVVRKLRCDDSGRFLYVLLHNIEGLADATAQALLSELAACPGIRLLASLDHVNGPLLWDKQTASRFNWLWHDVTTYAPYASEAAQMPALLVGRSEEKAVMGASMVLRTLVAKARDVFRIIAQHQLDAAEQAAAEGAAAAAGGMTFQALFRAARERFLVQNEFALRGHLAEFRDHELVVLRRGVDGGDVLSVPIEAEALRGLLEEMRAM